MESFLTSIGYAGWALHALIFLPVAGMFLVFAMPSSRAKHAALGVALLEFVLSVPLWWSFIAASGDFQLVSTSSWIPQWGISYSVGVDGISLLLVLLTTFLMPITVLGAYR